ncbi:CIC11C00000000594 [Sungouiella intermedia]|uniref:CIC11C00000000594 n=1 Tax=Sungouiella intermedia TaxID=45354 RepID=A0A1L0B7C2_9ASCO|nr:CIC11C00000000594 [[Candida] intermedia]
MADSLHTISTGQSSVQAFQPEALEERPPTERRPSLLERFTTAASSFILTDSEAQRKPSVVGSETGGSSIHNFTSMRTEDEWFGSSQIYRSLTNRKEPIEEFPSLEEFSSEDENDPIALTGSNTEFQPHPPKPRRRESTIVSTIQSISRKFGFWDSDFAAERIRIAGTLVKNYVYLLSGFAIALSIYWGSYYQRSTRYKNVPFAVIIGDTTLGQLPPILGNLVLLFFQNVPLVKTLGNYHIWSYERILAKAQEHNNTIQEEVFRQVHHQHYRAAFFVHENATLSMYQALVTLNTTFNPATELLSVVYETGSDYNAVHNYISTLTEQISRVFAGFMVKLPWVGYMMQTLNSTQVDNVFNQAPQLFTSNPRFVVDDRLPVPEQVVQAPLQIGLIYLCIFTFFQFVFSVPIHMYIASKIKGLRYVGYRILAAQAAYVVLGLAYVLLNTAFQISFTKAFGNLGFLVIWAFAFLTMSSVGSLIEVLVLFCIILKPAMIGLVLLLVAVVNLAPTISPIVLCPDFYRYGYAMPVFNSYQLMQVAFFNSYKGHMGRNIGILCAWIVVTNAMMPFAMKWMASRLPQQPGALS